jgi:hypothetical protein
MISYLRGTGTGPEVGDLGDTGNEQLLHKQAGVLQNGADKTMKHHHEQLPVSLLTSDQNILLDFQIAA